MLSPHALRERLDDVLDVTDKRHQDRHRTLRATIEWSYGCSLTTRPGDLFRRLAVFAGGARLEAVEHIAGPRPGRVRGLGGAGRGLPGRGPGRRWDEPRVHLLNTTRTSRLAQLDADGGADAAYAALARWCRALSTTRRVGQRRSYAEWARSAGIRADLDNLRAALEWLVDGTDGVHRTESSSTIALAIAPASRAPRRAGQAANARPGSGIATQCVGDGAATLTRASACLNLAWELAQDRPRDQPRAELPGTEPRLEALSRGGAQRSPRGRRPSALVGELDAVAKWRAGDLAGAVADLDRAVGRRPGPTDPPAAAHHLSRCSRPGATEAALAMEREAAELAHRSVTSPSPAHWKSTPAAACANSADRWRRSRRR